MPYVSPADVTDGTIAPASWGDSVKAATDFLANPPACKINRTSTQSITDSTHTAVQFNAADTYDTNTMHDTVTNNTRITFTTAGIYVIEFHGTLVAASDYVAISVNAIKNAATVLAHIGQERNNTAVYGEELFGVWTDKFAAADFVELRVYQDNSANAARNLAAGAYATATWLGLG